MPHPPPRPPTKTEILAAHSPTVHTLRVRDVDDPTWLDIERPLCARAKAGDAIAFRALYKEFSSPLQTFLYFRLRNEAAADDALAETFRIALESIADFRSERSIWFWLRGIAQRQAVNVHRGNARAARAISHMQAVPMTSDMGWVEEHLDREKRRAYVRTLLPHIANETYRRVIALFIVDGVPKEELAERIGQPPQTFKVTLFRALEVLRKLEKVEAA